MHKQKYTAIMTPPRLPHDDAVALVAAEAVGAADNKSAAGVSFEAGTKTQPGSKLLRTQTGPRLPAAAAAAGGSFAADAKTASEGKRLARTQTGGRTDSLPGSSQQVSREAHTCAVFTPVFYRQDGPLNVKKCGCDHRAQ